MLLAISILGVTGKMGKRLLMLAQQDPVLRVVDTFALSDVAIDFSAPEATQRHLEAALDANCPLVIGTTGHQPEEIVAIKKAAEHIPIVLSANFSIGMALTLEMASLLKDSPFSQGNIAIYETHHIHKKDKPSGTALELARTIGTPKEIAIHSTREGETIGEHLLVCETPYERIEIKHTAHSRDVFAQGALCAAKKLALKAPGFYTLKELFQ